MNIVVTVNYYYMNVYTIHIAIIMSSTITKTYFG